MAKKRGGNDYFGLNRILSLILVIIPITSWVLGVVTRFMEGKWLFAVVRIFLGWIIWILDIYFMVTKNQIFRLG